MKKQVPMIDFKFIFDFLLSFQGNSNSMSMTAVSDDEQIKLSPPPPPATHCRLTPTSISTDIQPLDLSKKQNEQPLNLCSKRKRNTPVSLSKRNNSISAPSVPLPLPTNNPASSMLIPFYAISPFFDPNNQQDLLQQMQTFYLQLQQKLTKNE